MTIRLVSDLRLAWLAIKPTAEASAYSLSPLGSSISRATTRAAALAQGGGFVDLRPAIRIASAREMLHGPRDFQHFNRRGMEVLGQTVAERIDWPLAQGPCLP